VARAESLAGIGRSAEAAAALSTATALWSTAAARPVTEVPRPPPPVPPPAKARDSVVAPAPDPTRQIQALFAEYGAAIEARSLDAIRRTYPGLLPSQAREWEQFFQSVAEIDVELAVNDLKVAGDTAEARLEGVYVFRNPTTRRTQREPVAFQATLRREGNRWRIASLR
jgi:ketosteroid isomerase-like protein